MKQRVLIVVTNHDRYPDGKPTGLWLGELTHFYELFEQEGFRQDIASPRGGPVPLDPRSLSPLMMDGGTRRYHDASSFMDRLNDSLALDAVNWLDYDAIYLTGGHGTMWDFPDSAPLQDITSQLYESGRVVSAVCHGSCGLLNVTRFDGTPLIKGRQVTGYSWLEERIAMVASRVPFNLEAEMKQRGAAYRKGRLPLRAHVVADERLITGQNPNSARATARRVLDAIRRV